MTEDSDKIIICKNCIFWEPNYNEQNLNIDHDENVGTCHRYPPSDFGNAVEDTHEVFSTCVHYMNWCGEWIDKNYNKSELLMIKKKTISTIKKFRKDVDNTTGS